MRFYRLTHEIHRTLMSLGLTSGQREMLYLLAIDLHYTHNDEAVKITIKSMIRKYGYSRCFILKSISLYIEMEIITRQDGKFLLTSKGIDILFERSTEQTKRSTKETKRSTEQTKRSTKETKRSTRLSMKTEQKHRDKRRLRSESDKSIAHHDDANLIAPDWVKERLKFYKEREERLKKKQHDDEPDAQD